MAILCVVVAAAPPAPPTLFQGRRSELRRHKVRHEQRRIVQSKRSRRMNPAVLSTRFYYFFERPEDAGVGGRRGRISTDLALQGIPRPTIVFDRAAATRRGAKIIFCEQISS